MIEVALILAGVTLIVGIGAALCLRLLPCSGWTNLRSLRKEHAERDDQDRHSGLTRKTHGPTIPE